jgi:hypothetical protein
MIASVVRNKCDLEFSRACIKRGDGIDLVPILRFDLKRTVGFPGKPFAVRICDFEKKVQIIGGDAVFLQIAKAKVCVNLHCMTLLKGKPRIADLDLPGKVVAVGAAEPLVNGDFRRQRDLRMANAAENRASAKNRFNRRLAIEPKRPAVGRFYRRKGRAVVAGFVRKLLRPQRANGGSGALQ